ncbi:MAG: hypothetical protein JKX79_04990 [Labilibaculum sp.]|nr:hypothetical protein [Labilibaculum sp.]
MDALLSGLKEVFFSDDKLKGAVMDCVIGIDIATIEGLLDCESQSEFDKYLMTGAFQCVIPVVVGLVGDKFISKVIKNKPFVKKGYSFFRKKVNFGELQVGELLFKSLDLDNILPVKSVKTRGLFKKVLSKEQGAMAMDVLIEAGIDVSSISGRNFERLSNVLVKYGDSQSQALSKLMRGTRDINKMLVFLDNMVSNVDEYSKLISKIETNDMFSKTVTINGKTTLISNFFSSVDEAYKYHHKIDANEHYFAKIVNGEGIMIVIDNAGNLLISSFGSYVKSKSVNWYNEFIKENEKVVRDE